MSYGQNSKLISRTHDNFIPQDPPSLSSSQRKEYRSVLNELRNAFPFSESYIGKINPYTGESISAQSDYDEYLRQRALSVIYQRLYSQAVSDFSKAVSEKDEMLHNAEQKYRDELDCSASFDKKCRFLLLISLTLIVAVLIIVTRIPSIRNASYNDGFSAGSSVAEERFNVGYDNGYSDGYDDGHSDGYEEGHSDGYADGHSSSNTFYIAAPSSSGSSVSRSSPAPESGSGYIGNKSSHKFHYPSCSFLPDEKNRIYFDSRNQAVSSGYSPCGKCNP